MAATQFEFEFQSEVEGLPDVVKENAEAKLRKIGENYRDMTGASIAVRKEGGENGGKKYSVRIVAYIKPDNIAVNQDGEAPEQALREALATMERNVRERRNMIRDKARGRA